MSKEQKQVAWLGWIIFLTGVLYYCFAYLLRVYPSVMKPELMAHFDINAKGLGYLASFYYFAYAPMQLPVGLTVDKFGVRKSILFACALATAGAYLFAVTDTYHWALLGRFMVGMGASFAYVTTLKIATIWVPKRFFATATGMVTGCGMLAAIGTDILLTSIIQQGAYEIAIKVPVFVGLGLFFILFFLLRDKEVSEDDSEEIFAHSFRQLGQYLKFIAQNPQIWLIGFVGAALYLPATVYLDLWAIPYLREVHAFSPHQAAFAVSIMLAGWLLSSFASGALSDYFRSRKMPLLLSGAGALLISLFVFYVPDLPKSLMFILMFFFGVACGPHPLCFALAKENFHHQIAGTAVAFANFLIMMGGFVYQPLVGKILDMLDFNYTVALTVIPINLLLGLLALHFVRETAQKTAARVSQ